LFDFAEKNPKGVVQGEDGPKGYYGSSKWQDDYCWAAAWLYLATQNEHYLDEAFKYYDYYAPPGWIHCWNDVWSGTACILAEINDLYDKDSQNFEDRYKRASNKNQWEQIDFWKPYKICLTSGRVAVLQLHGRIRFPQSVGFCKIQYCRSADSSCL